MRALGDEGLSALLVMHMQNGVVASCPGSTDVVDRVETAIGAARARGIPVVYVRMTFRRGRPEMQPRTRANSFFVDFERGNPSAEIHAALRPRSEDLVVDASRASAFRGTDLEILLRISRIGRVILTGIGTSGVVLSTLIHAADLDYQVTVLSDGCTDPDAEVHRVLCEKIFPMRAEVTTTESWTRTLT